MPCTIRKISALGATLRAEQKSGAGTRVMVELGNMRNAGDAKRMTSRPGRATYARGLAHAVRTFLR